ncbi:hypothetical protein F4677DRAFT_206019 [Hypoxylon crocopeplum]|nr:hypothetical protein F4677DRAFT_206019 [Hypoxylon crocopeplum]
MTSDLSWTHDFCLACDQRTADEVYCSETCRLSDFEHASTTGNTLWEELVAAGEQQGRRDQLLSLINQIEDLRACHLGGLFLAEGITDKPTLSNLYKELVSSGEETSNLFRRLRGIIQQVDDDKVNGYKVNGYNLNHYRSMKFRYTLRKRRGPLPHEWRDMISLHSLNNDASAQKESLRQAISSYMRNSRESRPWDQVRQRRSTPTASVPPDQVTAKDWDLLKQTADLLEEWFTTTLKETRQLLSSLDSDPLHTIANHGQQLSSQGTIDLPIERSEYPITQVAVSEAEKRTYACFFLLATAMLLLFASFAISLWWSINQKDVSGGFGMGSYMVGISSLTIGVATYAHRQDCRCWTPGKTHLSQAVVYQRI